ncbi:amidase signature enzyme [Trichodelitschia bisporula]|uniref:Amidase signature enzyme n=1 Tax=Trichodelitschia bisporula TaxID=703511 RepID=A0A6G1I1H9_9PEZI|nr:amidase signature enzyme [Trichodelitschia bisporula]
MASLKFANYPAAQQTSLPYSVPPPAKNPIFRGIPLVVGAHLVTALPPLASFLYNNAGFSCLRALTELDNKETRYDPTVIPLASGPAPASSSYTARDALRAPPDVPARFPSVADYHNAYLERRTTPSAVVAALLPLIRRDATPRNDHATAFLESQVELITAAAAASTARYAAGQPLGVLDGVPVAVKDEVDIEGYSKRYGSARSFPGAGGTSWCVAQWESAGAIVVGKTNMHEMGMDTTNLNPLHGTPRNPYNASYYTGGSSGGSAYAVAAGLVPFALGCDGGGSIRIPASYCGVFGLKPSHGRVSDAPTPSLANTSTVVGPIAADMSALEVAYRVMAAPDPAVPASASFAPPQRHQGDRPKVLGVCKAWFERADEPVRVKCQAAIDWLVAKRGYSVVEIEIPYLTEGQLAHALTIMNEAASAQRELGYLSPATRILFALARTAPAGDFLLAQKVRGILMAHLAWLFKEHPGLAIVTPTTPAVGWAIKRESDLKYGCSDGDMSIRSMEYVWLANFTGAPAITVPVGYGEPVKGEGRVPIGLMAMGEWGSEEGLIELGYDAEGYLNEGLEGGRVRPGDWADGLSLVGEGKGEGSDVKGSENGHGKEEVKVSV